jgi:hypothetical protein
MNSLQAALAECANWGEPRTVEGNPFRLMCRLEPPATEQEVSDAWGAKSLPTQVRELWTTSRGAELFVDIDYGQWGLKLLSPFESAAKSRQVQVERPADVGLKDVVIGRFLGDQDLVVVDDHEAVLIALPLDRRADWYRPAFDLSEFLSRYVAASGAKFWESTN